MARILVIDDEGAMREMMTAALTAQGHTVVQAKAAREALELHRREPTDLIVTDLVMREMDGTELLRRLRDFSPSTPVIGVSGNRHGTMYLNMARLIGAAQVLAKPFAPADLCNAVARVLGSPDSPAAATPAGERAL